MPVSAEAPGTTSAEFLKIEVGARPAAMGGAYTATGNDVFAAHYNPASIARIGASQVAFQHNSWFGDVDQNYLAGAGQFGSLGAFAASVNWVSMGDMLRTTVTSGQAGTSTGSFDARDYSAALTWAQTFSDRIDAGVTAKLIGTEIDGRSGTAFAADGGIRYRATDNWDIGASFVNAGTELELVSSGSPLPLGFRLGTSARLLDNALVLSADLSGYRDEEAEFALGAEYTFQQLLSLRLGYDSRNDDADEGLTAGAGFRYRNVDVDYAYAPFGELGNSHRVSLTYSFDRSIASAPMRASEIQPQSLAMIQPSIQPIVSVLASPQSASQLIVSALALPQSTSHSNPDQAGSRSDAPVRAHIVSEFRAIGLSERQAWVAQAVESLVRQKLASVMPQPNQYVRVSLGVLVERVAFLKMALYDNGKHVHSIMSEGTIDRFPELVNDSSDRLARFIRTGVEELRFAQVAASSSEAAQ